MKTGVMSRALCGAARDRMWECNESNKLVRHDPATHVGPFAEDDTSDDPANKWGGMRWQLRSVGGEETLMDMLPRACEAMAAQLLGQGSYAPPTGGPFMGRLHTGKFLAPAGANTRGIYCTLPEPPSAARIPLREQPGIHFDSGAETDDVTDARFKVTGLIDDTPPNSGGFTVYPRSHARLYELAQNLRAQGLEDPDEVKRKVAALTKAIEADTEPVDCHGPAGTVVFWHRCTAHKVAKNYSDGIRQAVIYDFCSRTATEYGQRAQSSGQPQMPTMWELWHGDAMRWQQLGRL